MDGFVAGLSFMDDASSNASSTVLDNIISEIENPTGYEELDYEDDFSNISISDHSNKLKKRSADAYNTNVKTNNSDTPFKREFMSLLNKSKLECKMRCPGECEPYGVCVAGKCRCKTGFKGEHCRINTCRNRIISILNGYLNHR